MFLKEECRISGNRFWMLITNKKPSIMKMIMLNSFIYFIRFPFVDIAQFENAESKVGTLISAATNPDNLCRMDPAWNPWL